MPIFTQSFLGPSLGISRAFPGSPPLGVVLRCRAYSLTECSLPEQPVPEEYSANRSSHAIGHGVWVFPEKYVVRCFCLMSGATDGNNLY